MKKLQRKGRLLLRRFWAALGLLPAGAFFQACGPDIFGGSTAAYGTPAAYGMPPAYGMPAAYSMAISGQVVAAATGTPIPDIGVEIKKLNGDYIYQGTTGFTGKFHLWIEGEDDSHYVISFKDTDGEQNGSFKDKEYHYYTYRCEDADIGTIKLDEKDTRQDAQK